MDRLPVDGLPERGTFVVGKCVEEGFAEGGVGVEHGVVGVGEVGGIMFAAGVRGMMRAVMMVAMGGFAAFCRC